MAPSTVYRELPTTKVVGFVLQRPERLKKSKRLIKPPHAVASVPGANYSVPENETKVHSSHD